jgi:hypothetical protein
MKKKVNLIVDKFYKFFEMNVFDPENQNHKKIVQKRINKMMHTELMTQWLKESVWFNKDALLTDEVVKFLIDCAVAFYDEQEFEDKVNYNSKEWLEALDIRVSNLKKTN